MLPKPQHRHTFEGIGTRWSIETLHPLDDSVIEVIAVTVERYDQTWSRFRGDSDIAALRTAGATITLPPESKRLSELYRALYTLTRGSMTPLVGSSLEAIGYGADYDLGANGAVSAAPAWEDALLWEGTSARSRQGITLDIGAAGKGQLVDLLGAVLLDAGIEDWIIDGSGDFKHHGEIAATSVALEHPRQPGIAIGKLELANRAFAASAGNRRAWGEGLHHILDASTGEPTSDVLGTWVIADTAIDADALATALFFAPARDLRRGFTFEYARMYASGHLETSGVFSGSFFTRSNPAPRPVQRETPDSTAPVTDPPFSTEANS
ncbi:FAD:protein FMN transferase [Humidisolicoccus flavus]|uniref:FAD:protein FMN transferase n=1 Tax=Humidisolicoccus flavus TaxID=3111414 RepID=UPI0032431446